MGLPIKHRKKFISHKQRWDKQTIVDEAVLTTDYALKNKKEIRKVEFLVSKLKRIAKSFNKSEELQNSTEAKNFLNSLKIKGFLPAHAESLDDILDISLRDILERRLSNVVYKNKLAKTPSQSRQFVVHRHVKVGGKVVDSPSFLVTLAQEATLEFSGFSALADEEHPERKLTLETVEEVVEEAEAAKEHAEEVQATETEVSASDKKEDALDNEESDEVKE